MSCSPCVMAAWSSGVWVVRLSMAVSPLALNRADQPSTVRVSVVVTMLVAVAMLMAMAVLVVMIVVMPAMLVLAGRGLGGKFRRLFVERSLAAWRAEVIGL